MPEVPAHSTTTLIEGIDANTLDARAVVSGLSYAQFNWRPSPDGWSIAQNLGHLVVTNGGRGLEAIGESVREGRAANVIAPGPFRCGFIETRFVLSQAPPVTAKYKAPKAFQPAAELSPESALADYLRISGELRGLIESAAGLDLARIRTRLPALPSLLRALLRMSLVARLALINTHDARHIWQCERIRQHPGFGR